MGIELALNLNAKEIKVYLQRFDESYKRYKKGGVVFHFETETEYPVVNMDKPYDSIYAQRRVYIFIKKLNALYCGNNLVQSNVSNRLPSLPSNFYSTSALRYLSRIVKQL